MCTIPTCSYVNIYHKHELYQYIIALPFHAYKYSVMFTIAWMQLSIVKLNQPMSNKIHPFYTVSSLVYILPPLCCVCNSPVHGIKSMSMKHLIKINMINHTSPSTLCCLYIIFIMHYENTKSGSKCTMSWHLNMQQQSKIRTKFCETNEEHKVHFPSHQYGSSKVGLIIKIYHTILLGLYFNHS